MVKQSLIELFIKKKHSQPAKKNYGSNKTVVKHTDNTRSSDLFDMIDYEIKTLKPKDIF